MCGICGFTRQNIHLPDNVVEQMKEALHHRGPDGHGSYTDEQVAIGHQRLSIIDLAGGKQPVSNETGNVQAVVNGEIYNFRQLRTDLEKKGHCFASASDSEVLVHLYEEYGEAMVDHLIGMFAFAVWDRPSSLLLLGRDRYGQKPLYYAERKGQLIFASELKSLIRHPHVEARLEPTALHRYLAYEYVPAPLSIYQGVFKLDSGSILTWKNGILHRKRYWDFPVAAPAFQGTFPAACSRLLALLDEAVESQLVSDVPLGVFLSGGLDSSTVAALMARHRDPAKIRTFSIGFTEKSYDESPYAREVARLLGTDHHEEIVDAEAMLDVLPQVAAQFDEPFADASVIPTYILCRHTRHKVTVALSGDGGDELFAGYDPFPAHRFAQFVGKLPRVLTGGIIRNLIKRLSPSDNNMSFEFRANKFFRHLYAPPVLRNQAWLGTFDFPAQQELLQESWHPDEDPYDDLARFNQVLQGVPDIAAIVYSYLRTYLQEDILTKVDRASMAHALEVRSPLLDHRVGEFVATLPASWKLRGLTTKYILKKAASNLLPPAIIHRPKKGFGIPKGKWLRENLRPLLEECLDRNTLAEQGIFRPERIRTLLDEHFNRRRDHQKELWTLLMFSLWQRHHQHPSTQSLAT